MSETSDVDRALVAEKLAALADIIRLWRLSFPARQYDASVEPLRQLLLRTKANVHSWPATLEPVYHRVEYIIDRTVLAQQGVLDERAIPAWWTELIAQADTAAEHIKRLQGSLSE